MWKAKVKGRLIYSANYDSESETVKLRDWREKNEKNVSSNSGR
jgi:hypothetical protein